MTLLITPGCRLPLKASLTVLRRGVATSSQPVAITPSAQEVAAGRLEARTVQKSLEALAHDGLVVVEDVVDHAAIDALNAVMVRDAAVLMARGKDGPFNYNLGRARRESTDTR
jgi:hypothetical protein